MNNQGNHTNPNDVFKNHDYQIKTITNIWNIPI